MANSETATPLIAIEGLYQIFGETPEKVLPKVKAGASKDDILAETGHTVGLQDINLTVERGEIFVIMGLSGSGKSTLIRHFNRLIDPTAGEIKVEGHDIMTFSPKELIEFRRHKMSMVFQHFGLMPHRSVIDNVGYGLSIKGMKKPEWEPKAKEWLETVGLAGYEDQYPSQLSGGQQQRVGLARALCTDAEILLMDEAFSALDPLIRYDMQTQLVDLQENLHKTIIFITHDLDEALRLGDRIAVLKDGKLVQVGKPVDIILNPADDYVRAFAKDVNRAKALKVGNIMTEAKNIVNGHRISDILPQLQSSDGPLIWLKDGEYQGLLNPDVRQKPADTEISNEDLICTEQLSSKVPLQQVLPLMLNQPHALPVLNAKGEVIGQLDHPTLASALTVPEL